MEKSLKDQDSTLNSISHGFDLLGFPGAVVNTYQAVLCVEYWYKVKVSTRHHAPELMYPELCTMSSLDNLSCAS